MSLKFKVDENLPFEVALELNAAGHDALTVGQQSLSGQPDPRIAQVCQSEGRALLTLDQGFADIRR
jgi:predicted nuclease of predicted toxin-antitoxin system